MKYLALALSVAFVWASCAAVVVLKDVSASVFLAAVVATFMLAIMFDD